MNKNILIKLGALVTATVPIVGVVSCGKKEVKDLINQTAIITYFTANKDAKKTISIPYSFQCPVQHFQI